MERINGTTKKFYGAFWDIFNDRGEEEQSACEIGVEGVGQVVPKKYRQRRKRRTPMS